MKKQVNQSKIQLNKITVACLSNEHTQAAGKKDGIDDFFTIFSTAACTK